MVEVCPEEAVPAGPPAVEAAPARRHAQPGRLLVGLACLYFVVLANTGLDDFFNPDDSMNMYLASMASYGRLFAAASLAPWEGVVRPAGALFYKVIYERFGFEPLPFHLACFALLSANLALQFALARRLFREVPFAALALLASCFHGAMWSIYASTGTVYDILCGTFVLLALLAYAEWRATSRWTWLAAVWFATVLATQSKEMGYAVPLLLLSYEVCFARTPGEPLWRMLPRVAPAGVAAALGLAGLLAHAGPMFHDSAYRPHFTGAMYLDTSAVHLTSLFYRSWFFTGAQAIAVLAGTLALALLLRQRVMIFGWLFYNAALLPLSFVMARHDGYVLYVPYMGAVLYLAGLAQAAARPMPWRWAPAAVCLLLAVPITWCQVTQSLDQRRGGFGPGGQWLVRELAMTAALPGSPRRDRVILVDDPWGDERWQSMFILRLSRHAPKLEVVRTTSEELRAGHGPRVNAGDQVLRYVDHAYREQPCYGTNCDSAANLR